MKPTRSRPDETLGLDSVSGHKGLTREKAAVHGIDGTRETEHQSHAIKDQPVAARLEATRGQVTRVEMVRAVDMEMAQAVGLEVVRAVDLEEAQVADQEVVLDHTDKDQMGRGRQVQGRTDQRGTQQRLRNSHQELGFCSSA